MAKKRRQGWEDRAPRGIGPRLLDGEVPEDVSSPRGFAESVSWKTAVAILALGAAAALLSQIAC